MEQDQIKQKIEESTIQATPKQIGVFLDYIKEIKEGRPSSWGKLMRKNGYTDTSATVPSNALLDRKGWKQLISLLPEIEILANMSRIATGNKNPESGKVPLDKDQIAASKMLLKLGNRFPSKRGTITFKRKRQRIMDVTNNQDEN